MPQELRHTQRSTDDLQDRLQQYHPANPQPKHVLLHIIDHVILTPGSTPKGLPDQQIERMRKDIDIELVRDST